MPKPTNKRKTHVSKAAVSAVKKAAMSIKKKRGMNLSRKQILTIQRDKHHGKLLKRVDKEKEAKAQLVEGLRHAANKKMNKVFDHSELRVVHEGMVAAVEALGESVTPTSLLMCAMTTLGKLADKKKLPYLMTIITACIPKISAPLMQRLFPQLIRTCEQTLAEADNNSLVVAKTMKLVLSLLLAMPGSIAAFHSVKTLEPTKLNTLVMPMYVTMLRKVLQHAALTNQSKFFLDVLPEFVALCLNNFIDAPSEVTSSSFAELQSLFARTVSPQLVEDNHGHEVLDSIVHDKLTQMFKPHAQRHWALAADLVTTLFDRLNYLKRTSQANKYLSWFRSAPFLLRVLNKIRHVDDSTLNTHIEKAIVAIGKGMSVEQFVGILPFNPMDLEKVRVSGVSEDELWKGSYLVNIVRRIASHDSLPFFVQYFMPIIAYCKSQEQECAASNNGAEIVQWTALQTQYWRLLVGFCHYPAVVTNDSFRDIAKQLVTLLSTSLVDTAASAFHVLCSGYHKLASTEEDDNALDEDDESEVDEDPSAFAPGSQRKSNLEDDEVYLKMNDEGWNPHAFHNITQAAAQTVCETILAKYSVNIMPKLCNTLKTHDTSSVLDAIQSYSKVCSPSVMHTILKGILDVGSNIAEGHVDESVAPHQLSSSRRVVLDIACAIVGQIETQHLHYIFEKIVEPVISDPAPMSRLLQKKAYKLLLAMFEHRVKDIYPLFPRIMGLLAVGQQHVTVSGLKMRIKCINWALDACKMYHPENLVSAIKAAVGEIVLLSRERSSGARELAMEVIEKMQRYMIGAGCAPNALLHLVLAGLSGKTSMLVGCTIVCLAKIVYMSFDKLPQEDIVGTTSMCFQLMESTQSEIRVAAATFARMVLKLSKRSSVVFEAVKSSLPRMLMAIALVTSQPRVSSSIRVLVRVLLEKCIKRFGYDEVDSHFPMGSKRFLQYTQKLLRREEKKAEREEKKNEKKRSSEFDDLFLSSMKANADAAEDDLLGGGALTQFVAQRSALPFGGSASPLEDDPDDDMCLVMQGEKLRIMTKTERNQEAELQKRRQMADRLLRRSGGVMNPRQMAMSDEGGNGRKRNRAEDADAQDMENEELMLRYGGMVDDDAVDRAASKYNRGRTEESTTASSRAKPSVTTMKLRDQKQAKKSIAHERMMEDVKQGEEYSTGRGGGDVKRGKLDPFAYVPLNRRFMNKRHRRQAVQRFDAVINRGLKGNKARMTQGK